MKAIILAGGHGTRLWPMSRESRPKQFTNVVGEEKLIRDTYNRLAKGFPKEKIYFSVSPGFAHMIREEFSDVAEDHILVEPGKRDTGPAMGFVAAHFERIDPDEPIVFIPSDHYIKDEALFLNCLFLGESLIHETGKLVDIGIAPAFPSTILGYTKIGKKIETRNAIDVFLFAGHAEKPAYDVAKGYIASGEYLWHANYYMWTPRKFMAAFERFVPDMTADLRAITAMDPLSTEASTRYNELSKISFDYAVTEKLDPGEMLVLRGDFGWSDIGAWDTLYDRLAEDGGNVTKGPAVLLDTKGSLVYASGNRTVAVLGVDDLIVVDTEDALLVTNRASAQKVKQVLEEIKLRGMDSLL